MVEKSIQIKYNKFTNNQIMTRVGKEVFIWIMTKYWKNRTKTI